MARPFLLPVAVACLAATVVWGRSALHLQRAWRRITEGAAGSVSADLARSAFRKELHTAILYGAATIAFGVASISENVLFLLPAYLVLIPVGLTLIYGHRFQDEARMTEERTKLERRAEEVLAQTELAPRRWAARLAPEDLPVFEGYEAGHVYEAGTGLMAGDFYDFFPVGPRRLAAVIGDVSGHGIEPSITAFQVKYLLRVFLRQFRDPAQALEELNATLSTQGRAEEFVSVCIVVFDRLANSLRHASAGHPAAWLWHDGEVRPLRATGPLLTLDPRANYISREIDLTSGDLVLLYTDGLAEARSGEQLFGEDRIASAVRRDPGIEAQVLCKSLLQAAREFASGPLRDDVAILAIRRT
jgi:serine phosphatase RsbU (regulator of sigma subunit)